MDFRRTTILLALAAGVGMIGLAPTVRGAAPIPEQFARDTIYHAVIDLDDSTICISYGAFPLVDCSWQPVDSAAVAYFAATWHKADKAWQTVTARRLWSGIPAVPQREVGVVAEMTHADPLLIQRVLPDRFSIGLSDGFRLHVMTVRGSIQRPAFREWLNEWLDLVNPLTTGTCLHVIVSPEDAQTLYYALEPGTPVLIRKER